ncbi:MAG TPA: hypothetical protein PKD61_38305, partial [Polyangiaceae bacterium]|nr:hypothetical protein [Polyangiaceae bacterium]
MSARTISLRRLPLVEEKLSHFRYGKVAGRHLVTNDMGAWHFLDEASFEDLLAGRIDQGHAEFKALQEKGFLREGFDLDRAAEQMQRKKRFVGQGPHL